MVDITRGIFISGTLHIAAILSTDDGVTFQCVANNEIIREQTTGPRYQIIAIYPEVCILFIKLQKHSDISALHFFVS